MFTLGKTILKKMVTLVVYYRRSKFLVLLHPPIYWLSAHYFLSKAPRAQMYSPFLSGFLGISNCWKAVSGFMTANLQLHRHWQLKSGIGTGT